MSVTLLAPNSCKQIAWPGGRFSLNRRSVDGTVNDRPDCAELTVIADLGCVGELKRDLWIAGDCYRGSFTPRHVHCVPGRVEVEQRFAGRARCAYAVLTLEADLLALASARLCRPAPIEIEPRTHLLDAGLLRLVRLMARELRADDHACTLVLESLAMIAAVYLLRRHTRAGALSPAVTAGLDRRRLAHVTDYIEANLGQPITTADLAAVAYLSRYHFCRRFKTSTGVTPHRYITDRRLEQAKRLLAHTQLGISEVAQQVGLSSHSHLSRLFRHVLGVGPAQFRRAAARRV